MHKAYNSYISNEKVVDIYFLPYYSQKCGKVAISSRESTLKIYFKKL